METEGFFAYPDPEPPEGTVPATESEPPGIEPGFLDEATEQEWESMLAFTQTQYVYTGDDLITEGQTDRAFYLLTSGRVVLSAVGERIAELEAPAPLNEVAFLDGGPCTIAVTASAECEVLRLSYDAFESLAAHEPVLARKLLFEVARIVASTLRAV